MIYLRSSLGLSVSSVCCHKHKLAFWGQASIILVVILLQDRAVHCPLSPAGSGYIPLTERRIPATEVAVQGEIFGEFSDFLRLHVFCHTIIF